LKTKRARQGDIQYAFAENVMDADVVAEWGREGLAQELLVGFEPIQRYLGLLEERFAHLGQFFADYNGGDVIAVKWQPQVCLVPQP